MLFRLHRGSMRKKYVLDSYVVFNEQPFFCIFGRGTPVLPTIFLLIFAFAYPSSVSKCSYRGGVFRARYVSEYEGACDDIFCSPSFFRGDI